MRNVLISLWRYTTLLLLLCSLQGTIGCRCAVNFSSPAPPRPAKALSKKVIAGPNDTVAINNGRVYVNGHLYQGNTPQVQETVQKTFRSDRVNALRVRTSLGDIQVVPAAEGINEIKIVATKTVSGNRPVAQLQPYLHQIATTAQLDASTLAVESNPPDGAIPNDIGVSVSYVVTVPRRLAVDLYSTSGSIEVQGATGGVKLHSDLGDLKLADVGGDIDATTNSGAITIEGANTQGHLAAHTDLGDLTLEQVRGKVNAVTNSGTVTIREAQIVDSLVVHSDLGNIQCHAIQASGSAPKVDLNTSSGSIDFSGDTGELTLHSSLGDITAEIASRSALNTGDIHTDSGSITLTLSRSASAKIDMHTSSGSITLTGIEASEEHTDGDISQSRTVTLGGGNAPIHLQTDLGNITVRAR